MQRDPRPCPRVLLRKQETKKFQNILKLEIEIRLKKIFSSSVFEKIVNKIFHIISQSYKSQVTCTVDTVRLHLTPLAVHHRYLKPVVVFITHV